MIDRSVLYSTRFYKSKGVMTGSYKGMRYRVVKQDDEHLLATIFPEPYNYETTDDELKVNREFELSEEGLDNIAIWLNEEHKAKKWK